MYSGNNHSFCQKFLTKIEKITNLYFFINNISTFVPSTFNNDEITFKR